MRKIDILIIGGGPAGMSAALSASKNGSSVLIVERDTRLGGILNQCIHQGFGLHYFGEEMTGPEYAQRFRKQIEESNVEVLLNSMVLGVRDNDSVDCLTVGSKIVSVLSPMFGIEEIEAKALVLAMGCRERTAGAITLAGSRPAGVYTAGMAQKLCNIDGYLVGKNVVILGSGDIGLIMARRMTLEGAKVNMVLELMPYSSGLKRNIVQCLNDFSIPINYAHTITRLVGKTRLEGLYYAPIDENRKPIMSEEKYIECDTLLLSVGLIPENDLIADLVQMSRITQGAVVDENRMTSHYGIFACGNVLHVHDLVDNVSVEAEIAGLSASKYAQNQLDKSEYWSVNATGGVRYALPQKLSKNQEKVKVYFRVDNVYNRAKLVVRCNDEVILTKPFQVLAPGEMESFEIDKSSVVSDIVVELIK